MTCCFSDRKCGVILQNPVIERIGAGAIGEGMHPGLNQAANIAVCLGDRDAGFEAADAVESEARKFERCRDRTATGRACRKS